MSIEELLNKISAFVWGFPLIILILLTGIIFTIKLKFVQIFKLPLAFKYLFCNREKGSGEVSSFGALCTSLAATIGTGSIIGVATAIKAGGPGALFWMCIAAFFGMAVKYAECLLGVKYRRFFNNNEVCGGPFYYIEKGMGKKFKWLAVLFAFFGCFAALFGIGTMVQSNSISTSVVSFFNVKNNSFIVMLGIGIIVSLLSGMVILGGIKRIASVSQIVIPFMSVFYLFGCLLIICFNIDKLQDTISLIFKSAFSFTSAIGGFAGAGVMAAVRIGIARGIFSNEAGLGSEPIAAAAAKTNYPPKQGLISMTGTFIDTILICNLTGIVLIITGAWKSGLDGAAMTNTAFESGFFFMPILGKIIVTAGLVFFAFTSIIGWCYYGERCAKYLWGDKAVKYYHFTYILFVFAGSIISISMVWHIADIFNGLMALPNLIAVLFLSKIVKDETNKYFSSLKYKNKTAEASPRPTKKIKTSVNLN